MSGIKLKRCPFCGGKAKIDKNEEWPDCARQPDIFYTVGCDTGDCVCERDCEGTSYDTEEEARVAWDTRNWRKDR